jgi:hypothetical protein
MRQERKLLLELHFHHNPLLSSQLEHRLQRQERRDFVAVSIPSLSVQSHGFYIVDVVFGSFVVGKNGVDDGARTRDR